MLMVTDEDENVKEDIWKDITLPKIHAKVTAIQEANITRIETEEVEKESFEHDQWLDVTEGESRADIASKKIPLEDITVFEVVENLQSSDEVDAEYETDTQPTTEQVHSVESHAEKVSRDTEMKEMETAEVQESCEDNQEVSKEIKVLRLTWEELLLAERHMESEKHAEAEIQPNNEQVHSGESHAEKVSRDTEMKEMETAEVQESCEDNKVVSKEIKVLRLTWEELLLAERHLESEKNAEAEIQPNNEQVHSGGSHAEKVCQDTEMKEMETAEVQESCEDNQEVSKEIKVLRLTWEELLLAERHMESEKHAEAEIQPNNEQVHSGESHDEKVFRDTEMKEMETTEVQKSCEVNKEVAKEIKVLRLTWEELLLAERHMESAVVEDLSSDQVKSTRLTLPQEDPAIQAFKIISNDR